MASLSLLRSVAVGFAFLAAVMGASSLCLAVRRGMARGAVGGTTESPFRGLFELALRNGVKSFHGPARTFLKNQAFRNFFRDGSRWFESRGMVCPEESAASLSLAATLVFAIVGALITGSPLGGLVLDALLFAILATRIQAWKEREQEALRNAVPLALGVMGDCFQSGYSLMQTMEQVSEQTEGVLSVVFGRCADALKLGGTTREALDHIRGIQGVEELSFVAVALDVQHQSGGSFASVLSNAQRMVADEIELRRSLQVQTAQARLSAQVVCLMPFVLMAVLSFLSEGFLSAFFESPAGVAMLIIAVLMEVTGIALVRRMLKVAA